MTGHIGAVPVPQAVMYQQEFTALAGQTTFNTRGYQPGYLQVHRNGVLLAEEEYTATDGNSIVMATGVTIGSKIAIRAWLPFEVAMMSFFNADVDANGYKITGLNSINGNSVARNLVINGDMVIAQTGAAATGVTSGGYYAADMWRTDVNLLGTWTVSQDTDAPAGFAHSLKLDCTTADVSPSTGDYIFLRHYLEGKNLQHLKKGTAAAETVTVSFNVKSNKTGTFQVNLVDYENSRVIAASVTIDVADTWEYKTVTFVGDTLGTITNDTGGRMGIEMWFDGGNTWTGGTTPTSWEAMVSADRGAAAGLNLADSTSNYLNITGVQLEVGDTASTFVHKPFADVLRDCLRYFYRAADGTLGSTGVVDLAAYSGGNNYGYIRFPVEMRSNPSMTYSAGSHFWGRMSNNVQCSSLNTQGAITKLGATLYAQSTSTTGNAGWLEIGDSAAYLDFDARM